MRNLSYDDPQTLQEIDSHIGLILPSTSKCRMIRRVGLCKGVINPETEAAFKAICRRLNSKDRILRLGIDETTQIFELCGCKFHGYTDEGEIAKAMLSVHTSSACGNFSEMVSMTLRVASHQENVTNVLNSSMHMLTNAEFRNFTIIFDGHRINQYYYSSVYMSAEDPSFPNPSKPEEGIFSMFGRISV